MALCAVLACSSMRCTCRSTLRCTCSMLNKSKPSSCSSSQKARIQTRACINTRCFSAVLHHCTALHEVIASAQLSVNSCRGSTSDSCRCLTSAPCHAAAPCIITRKQLNPFLIRSLPSTCLQSQGQVPSVAVTHAVLLPHQVQCCCCGSV